MAKATLLICLTVILALGYGQQPVIQVQSFEYIWQKSSAAPQYGSKLNILTIDTVKKAVEKSFAKAIQQRWNVTLPTPELTVKTFSILNFSSAPKFNTKIKEKQPDIWYLFIQLFEDGATVLYNLDRTLGIPLHVKCKLITGTDSVIFDRNLFVKMNKEKPAPDQVVLERLAAHPAEFIKAFDSIPVWLFQPEAVAQKDLWLKPAVVYADRKSDSVPIAQLLFENTESIIRQVTEPAFVLQSSPPNYTTKAAHKNAVGNTATGAVTLFTGVGINKVRTYEYAVDFPFKENDSTAYNCTISYAERETAGRDRVADNVVNDISGYSLKSGTYAVVERRVNEQFLQVLTSGADTLATFTISYQRGAKARNSYTQLWNGSEPASIMPLPDAWNNKAEEDNIVVSGKAGAQNFTLKSKDENTVKEFYFNDKLSLVMFGKSKPYKALVMEPLSPVNLRLCTILAWLPYTYFNYGVD